jgi:DNA polymerase III subunit delta'
MNALIGHDKVKRLLEQTSANSIILEGTARVGRRGLARWYAMRLNCKAPVGLEPCGVCVSCQNFVSGSHSDLLEISPREETSTGKRARVSLIPIGAISASHDTAKDFENHVLEFIELSPRYQHKVIIFDGAQFLNESAANALLKSIEEPPHKARFVFITEDASGMIPTIVSRSQRYRVPPVPDHVLEQHMKVIDPELLLFAAGRPGLILEAERTKAVIAAAQSFLEKLQLGLLEALTAADMLEKNFDRLLTPDALRFALRNLDAPARVKADASLEMTLHALERYATPSTAFSSLALEWRKAVGVAED